jgi:hypothetical protein
MLHLLQSISLLPFCLVGDNVESSDAFVEVVENYSLDEPSWHTTLSEDLPVKQEPAGEPDCENAQLLSTPASDDHYSKQIVEVRMALLVMWAKFLPSEQLFTTVCRIFNTLIEDSKFKLPVTLDGFMHKAVHIKAPTPIYYCLNNDCQYNNVGLQYASCTTCGEPAAAKDAFFLHSYVADGSLSVGIWRFVEVSIS